MSYINNQFFLTIYTKPKYYNYQKNKWERKE